MLCYNVHLPLFCMKYLEKCIHQVVSITENGRYHNKLFTNMYPAHAEYYFDEGFRKVKPYYKINSYFPCNKNKANRSWNDVIMRTFPKTVDGDQITENCKQGMVFLNYDQVETLNIPYINGKLLTFIQYIEEKAVNGATPQILHDTDGIVVVNKPHGIPIQSKLCYYNCLANILLHEYGYRDLKAVHRIDEMTSGVQIFARTRNLANYLINTAWKDVTKEYVARVTGVFPSHTVVCDRNIIPLDPVNNVYKYGTTDCVKSGKKAKTIFTRMSTNGRDSIVRCKPLTGRTHQIRVHLQHLGFPIFKDHLYNQNLKTFDKGGSSVTFSNESYGLHSTKYVIPGLGMTFKSPHPDWTVLP